ncbi:MAG: 4,5-dihydroxyphthalate decarboxylase [Azoarcus sp.]|nr:4,5-dihydroxyphthalate decarboxylase [Azoarcus sp.]
MILPQLTLALDRYDRHLPYFLGLVPPPSGFRVRVLEVGMVPPRRDGVQRHRRMLHDEEFDVAETSLASYIMARAAGAPFTAIPAFPRRLFSQNHIFVRRDAGIERPSDLTGKRVAIWAFQVTLSVLARGDLQRDYGVPWRGIHWFCEHREELPWRGTGECAIERVPEGTTGAELLLSGKVDAYIDPHPPQSILDGTGGVRPLFADPRAECVRYHGRHGYYPIMHLQVLRRELADEYPRLARELLDGWEHAQAMVTDFYRDPNFTSLPLGLQAWQEQRAAFGDVWASGFTANRRYLEDFVSFMHEQRLIAQPLSVEDLFHPSVTES